MSTETLILLSIIGFGLWYYSRNSTNVDDKTTIVTRQKTYVNGVEQEVTRTTTVKSRGYALNNSPQAEDMHAGVTRIIHQATPENTAQYLENKIATERAKNRLLMDRHALLESQSLQNTPYHQPSRPAEQSKYCPNCKRRQPASEFFASTKYSDGLTKWCATCLRGLQHSKRKRK